MSEQKSKAEMEARAAEIKTLLAALSAEAQDCGVRIRAIGEESQVLKKELRELSFPTDDGNMAYGA